MASPCLNECLKQFSDQTSLPLQHVGNWDSGFNIESNEMEIIASIESSSDLLVKRPPKREKGFSPLEAKIKSGVDNLFYWPSQINKTWRIILYFYLFLLTWIDSYVEKAALPTLCLPCLMNYFCKVYNLIFSVGEWNTGEISQHAKVIHKNMEDPGV